MTDLVKLAFSDRSLFHFDCLMDLTNSKRSQICFLPLGGTVLAYDLSYLEFCPDYCLLSVKYFVHRDSAESGDSVGISHLSKSGNSRLDKIMRI